MRLTRLEIFGFKSFVERFVLNFDKNRIGIVGPNGCGKSNIVDALRWVLGETYAKQLRGNVLEDLIFNGSESRRPLGMAEVIITIRPEPGWSDNLRLEQILAAEKSSAAEKQEEAAALLEATGDSADASSDTGLPDGEVPGVVKEPDIEEVVLPQALREIPGLLNSTEIQFTRRLYRSGESEYFINRVPCRLRDMVDVYRVIGLGARGLSIVQQGEIGQFISRKPIERRELLEEAAGISGFRTRMEVAQRKLEKTAENMDRLKDIIDEVEKQVRVLRRQATRARERNELKGNILREDLALFRGKKARFLLRSTSVSKILLGLNEGLTVAESELLGFESRQGEIQAELEECETLIGDKRRSRDALQAAFERERARIQGLEVNRARLQSDLGSCDRERAQIFNRREQFAQELERLAARGEDLTRQIAEAVEKRDEAEKALKSLQQDETRRSSVEVDLSLAKEAVPENLRVEIAELEQRVGRMLGVENELKELERESEQQRRAQEAGRKELHGVELKLTEVESEVRSLERQLEALAEQVAQQIDSTGKKSGEDSSGRIRQVLLAGLKVPEAAQRAVSAILGERAQYLVSDDAMHSAKAFSEKRLKSNERSARLGVIRENLNSQLGSSDGDNAIPSISDEVREHAPSARALYPLLLVDPNVDAAVKFFLGQYILVDTLDEAIRLCEFSGVLWVVTASGEVFTPWGWFTTEGKGAAFSFTRRIDEMKQERIVLSDSRDILRGRMKELEEKTASILATREALVGERRELSENDRRLTSLHRQVLDIERQERERLLAQSRRMQEQLLREEREAQDRLRTAVTSVAKVQQEEEFCRSRSESLRSDEERTGIQLNGIEEREAQINASILQLEEEIERGMFVETDMTMAEFQRRCVELDEELKALGERREPARLSLSETAREVSESRANVQRLADEIRKASLQEEKGRLEYEMLTEELKRQHPESEEALAALAEVSAAEILTEEDALREIEGWCGVPIRAKGLEGFISETQETVQRLMKRLEREGEVDPQSIELFETEDARLRGMQEQLQDLEEARKILDSTIRRLKEISRQRFLETFAAVNTTFQQLIPRLFGGGAGHLELLNPDDPLTSGVELMVRPPGKRLGSMELMSGGEKALVAISVLISMFLHRPSPICVLDEVDAPLDEANLERYLALIAEISRRTQFLVITHNKRTMADADRLVGITMQEKGVSTALSVELEDAPELLASIPGGPKSSATAVLMGGPH